MTAGEFAQRLEARRVSGGWQARCPAHEDKHASLSIREGSKGVLLRCHAGCDWRAVVDATGINPSQLFADEQSPKQKPRIVAEYDYRDGDGELRYQVVRLDPKSFRQRRPHDGGWEWNLRGVDPLLYATERLAKLSDGARVVLVEGEKDADRLWSLGIAATTNSGGAAKWTTGLTAQIARFDVVALPDNDKPGKAHAEGVVDNLRLQGGSARLVALPNLAVKGDVSDWLDDGGSKLELERLLRANQEGFRSSTSRLEDANAERIANIARVMPYNVSYLDDELLGIHPNDIAIIMAATGAGKTTLGSILAQKAAEEGKRVRFFALEAYQHEIEVRTLFRETCKLAQDAGDWCASMTQQRWIKQGIPELDGYTELAIANLKGRISTLQTYYRTTKFDREDVREQFLKSEGETDLIILDHLHYIDSDGTNENHELKQVVQVIRDCGQALRVPVIVIAHIRKRQGGMKADWWIPSVEDIHGSSDVAKMATTIIAVAPARDSDFLSKEPGVSNTFMAVLKDRIGGDKGFAALMQYDLGTMQYRAKYKVCRRLHNGKVEHAEHAPLWAKRGVATVIRQDEQHHQDGF